MLFVWDIYRYLGRQTRIYYSTKISSLLWISKNTRRNRNTERWKWIERRARVGRFRWDSFWRKIAFISGQTHLDRSVFIHLAGEEVKISRRDVTSGSQWLLCAKCYSHCAKEISYALHFFVRRTNMSPAVTSRNKFSTKRSSTKPSETVWYSFRDVKYLWYTAFRNQPKLKKARHIKISWQILPRINTFIVGLINKA